MLTMRRKFERKEVNEPRVSVYMGPRNRRTSVDHRGFQVQQGAPACLL